MWWFGRSPSKECNSKYRLSQWGAYRIPYSRNDYSQPINVINVLRKQVIIGTLRGRVLLYSIVTAQFMCQVWIFCELSLPSYSCERALQVDAHARAVTSISVAPESAYVLSSGEDCRFIVYKLHTRKPHAYEVWPISSDCRFSP